MKNNMQSKFINGKSIEYNEVIYHNTTSQFTIWDRIKILFGKKVITNSTLYCNEIQVNVLASEARTYVERMFPEKNLGYGTISK